ncbi:protein DEK-like [Mizuhopecten yessoensis]|uniref:Protein DEK n=1 Tax=Mizuhopecten yessoensis TaxID=6573 RepID=A0A210QF69_MIZYE|nr:protein DEK-like [Mizuhopecten yessoensis]OWF47407.1 Protein DEK [Mizuhopecten yessoensis]
MSDTEDRENSPVSKEEEDNDVQKMESDSDEDANHENSDDVEPSATKLESSTAAINESTTKSPSPKKKKQAAKKEVEDEVEEENEDESDGEPKLGLLERPVVIESGKRQKKKVERLDISGNATPKEKKQIEFDGAGLKLGDCPRIELQIQKNKADDLKVLHRFLFGLRGATNAVKKNLRNFNGFNFEKDDKEYEKKAASLIKYTMAMLKQLCGILDLERQGSKEQVIERLMTFCVEPKDSGKKVPKPKRKRGAAAKKEKGVKRKRASKKEMEERRKNAKKAQEDDDDDEEEEEEENDEDESVEESNEEVEEKESEKSESSEEESAEEEEEEAPKKKKRKIETPKKTSPKEKKAKKPAAKKETKKPKVTPKKVAAPVVSDSDSEDSEDSDDEPLQKKAKPAPPTNDDLKTLVKKILDKANLEEVTMKSVIKEVYGKYPAFDLTDRKDYIKKTVKQLIT